MLASLSIFVDWYVTTLQLEMFLQLSQDCCRTRPTEFFSLVFLERTYFGCAAQQGRLFAFGGQNFEYKALCDAETYDILRDTWYTGKK